MQMIHAIKSAVRVDSTRASWRAMLAVECAFSDGYRAAETSFRATLPSGPALTEEAIYER
jgi:hypothetical protein